MPLRHVSSGIADRQREFLRTLAIISIVLGTFFAGLNFALGTPELGLLELILSALSLVILIFFKKILFVESTKWLFLSCFLLVEVYALCEAPSASVFIWSLLILPVGHRLLGLRTGSIVSVVVLTSAAAILVSRYGLDTIGRYPNAVADFGCFAIVLFFSSYAHERDIHKADRQIRARADMDNLTRLIARPRLYELFESARDEARRGQRNDDRSVTMILIDLDHFKTINDTYGHLAGDRVLSTVSQRLFNQCREADLLGRVGGEELAMLLFGMGQKDAMARAERLRRAIADSPVVTSDAEVRVTASFGVATHELADTSFDALFEETDRRLYAAKTAGRNCVVGAPES